MLRSSPVQSAPQTRRRVLATLPLRSLDDGKHRLRRRLSPAERRELVVMLCDIAIVALRESRVVDEIALVSGDNAILELAREWGVVPLHEDAPDLNAALLTGLGWTQERGADAHLIVLPDLPTLRASDIRAVVEAAWERPGVVVCPDRTRMGTNLLLTQPGGAIPPLFGADSFDRHRRAAAEARLAIAVLELPGTSWDIDTAEDFDEWSALRSKA